MMLQNRLVPPPSAYPETNVHIMVAFIFIYNFCRQQDYKLSEKENEIERGRWGEGERGSGIGSWHSKCELPE